MRDWSKESPLLARVDRIGDLAVAGFALFTVAAHVAVFVGAGLATLTVAAVAVAAAAAAALVWFARVRRSLPGRSAPYPDDAPARSSATPAWQRTAARLLAAAAGLAHWGEVNVTTVWTLSASAAVAIAVFTFRNAAALPASSDRAPSAAGSRSAAMALGLAALVCVAVTLMSHRPDADDAFYLNLAVTAADHPDAPLLANDSLHGIPDVPIALPVYRVHSLELLEAAVSRATGIAVLDLAHLALPLLAALLLPFAHARLLRRLVPERWLIAALLATAFLAFSGGGSHGWQNFGLVRLHQGKAILLTLLLPLVAAYAIEYVRRPSPARWLLLAASQIAAVGLSASALWLAPAAAAISAAAALSDPRSEQLKRLGGALAASTYVVVLALALRGATEAAFQGAAVPSPEASAPSAQLAHQAARAALGGGPMAAFMLFAALASWSFCETPIGRRFCALFVVGWLALWNPFTASFVAAHLTSPPTYWRAFWLVPMATLVAVVLSAPYSLGLLRRRWLGPVVIAGIAACVFLLAPRQLTLSRANHVSLGTPGWQVPAAALQAALALREHAGPGAAVLAPTPVAPWVVTLHDHPYPLVVRTAYLPALAAKLPPAEIQARIRLQRLVSGEARPPHAGRVLREAIDSYDLRAVALARETAEWDDLSDALADAGFEKVQRSRDYEVWAVPAAERPQRPGTHP